MNQNETISALLNKNNINLSEQQIKQLSLFYDLVIKYNQEFNITAITNLEDFVCKHFADCLIDYQYYTQNALVCDIGTGGGFPGIPLKIVRPDLKITLVDSLQKRVNFLNTVIKSLQLTDIIAIHSRAQELPQNNVSRETFDYVISRAVAPLNILTELCLPFVSINGEMIAYKAQNAENELKTAQNAIHLLGGKYLFSKKVDLIASNNELLHRNLIHIKKETATDIKYPRQKNKITTYPL